MPHVGRPSRDHCYGPQVGARVEARTAPAPGRTRTGRLLWLVVVVAVVLRVYPWTRPHSLLGVLEVDDGVYYGAAKAMLHGLLPYSDFTILHPPVTSLLLLPFAAVGAVFGDPVGMASARVLIAGVAVANVLLVYRLALRLPSRTERPALLAAAVYAVMPNAVIAEHTLLLEPLVNLFCLLAVLCLLRQTPRYAVLAGILLSAGAGVKVFAGAYIAGVLIWLVLSGRRASVRPLVGGLAFGSAVLLLPFFALAPSSFWHDLVVTQLARPADGTPGGLVRELDTVVPHLVSLALTAALLAVVLGLGVLTQRRAPQSATSLWVFVGGLGGFAFLTSPSYFAHYGAFLVPPLALLLSRLVEMPRLPAQLRAGGLAVVVAAFAALSIVENSGYSGQGDLRAAGRLLPPGSCVFYEAISLAVAADVLSDPSATCPAWVDGRGVALTWNTHWPHTRSFYPAGFLADARWQAETVGQLTRADFLLLYRDPAHTVEWTVATQDFALRNFTPVWVDRPGDVRAQLWRRTSARP